MSTTACVACFGHPSGTALLSQYWRAIPNTIVLLRHTTATVSAGGVDALLVVAGGGAEPVLAAAAMQALTALVGNADAKAMLLQHPSFLDGLLSSMHTGRRPSPASAPHKLVA